MTAEHAVISADYARGLASGLDRVRVAGSLAEAQRYAGLVREALRPVLAIVGEEIESS